MLKFISLFALYIISINVILSNTQELRTITVFSSHLLMANFTTGLKIDQKGNNLNFLWTEEFNNKTNSFKVYVNFFFANTGIRQIVTLENACGTYKKDSIEAFLQVLVLGGFANTDKCPIKKGTAATFSMPLNYTFLTENRACGPTFAMYNVFKTNPKKPKAITPVLFVATFPGHITGPNCYPKAKYNYL